MNNNADTQSKFDSITNAFADLDMKDTFPSDKGTNKDFQPDL